MEIFQTRDQLNQFIQFKTNPIIAEIGVFECEFSQKLYNMFSPKELHLFDLFRKVNTTGSGDMNGNGFRQTTGENIYNNAVNTFKNKPNVFLHEGYSNVTLGQMQNDYFDLIYVDGDHSEAGVYSDLMISYDKIKKDGWIVGHDFALNKAKCQHDWDFSGVRRAVNRFCSAKNLRINAFFLDGCLSFAIQKKITTFAPQSSGVAIAKAHS